MNTKKCIKCLNNNVIKKGFQGIYQVWYCKDCKIKFQANRKALPVKEELFYSFSFHKQTLKELQSVYHIRKRDIQIAIDQFKVPKVMHKPSKIHLLVDATYFGSKENTFCVIVFRDAKLKRNIWWQFSKVETESVYLLGRKYLEALGYVILSVTADGLALIRSAFKGIPFQMCLVHMERIILRGTTRKPKLEAGQVLFALTKSIHTVDKEDFANYMNKFTLKYFSFLNERSYSESTNESWYTHDELRKVFMSLQNLHPYLFTYLVNPNIPKTTNSLEGCFAHIKNKLAVHHGLSIKRRKKLIEVFLYYGSGVEDYEK